jgi:TetR/AcrR family transcriptional repressor of nem operon
MSTRKEEILDIAQDLTQSKGFNGFSYNDISAEIGIKTSSIHYYFKSKDDLAIVLIERYHHNFRQKLAEIDAKILSPREKLMAFSGIFKSLAEAKDKFCLCGMMAAEHQSISVEAQNKLRFYFKDSVDWISSIFVILGSKTSDNDAKAYLALLEGALLMARIEGGPSLLDQLALAFISKFEC